MSILFFKAIHVVGFVSWFAGMFFLVRLFVYHVEAFDKEQPEKDILVKQFNQIEWRVYKIILTPAMMITWICGLAMLYLHGYEWFKINTWMHTKLLLLILLSGYHGWTKRMIKKLETGVQPYTSFQFRLWNELPTLFLLSIALLAVYRNNLDFLYAFLGVLGFAITIFMAARLYRNSRMKTAKSES